MEPLVILLVDDEPDLGATCERLLRREGYAVVVCGTRRAALAVLRERPLHLLVSDIRLPDGDGLELVRAARGLVPAVPSIVTTGYPSPSGRDAALGAGATAYLPKPFSAGAFVGAVERILGRAS